MDRRELLKHVAGATALSTLAGRGSAHAAAQAPGIAPSTASVSPFYPGFATSRAKTSGAELHVVKGGQGAPLLLLHGAPQTHITWRLVAPMLMQSYTLVIPDLRGYGDSSKPADTPDHANYSKRAMALDMVELMKSFGYDRFAVVGQDRGGRVGHRLALDHPDTVTKLSVLDIVPTHYHYTHVTKEFVQAYFHWFNYLRPAPMGWPTPAPNAQGPEIELLNQAKAQEARLPNMNEVQKEYYRSTSNPANIHGMCEDYRAAASIDLKHDEEDIKAGKKMAMPVQALWSTRGPIGRLFEVQKIWQDYSARPVVGKGLNGGHYLQEDVAAEVVAEVTTFLRA